jgi:hypothetical protein
MSAWKYLTVVATTALAILAVIAGVNYRVDLSELYHTSEYQRRVDEYARRLVTSEYGLRSPPAERGVKLALAETTSADCYVIGSSHEMTISLDRMPLLAARCSSVVNLAASAAGFQDAVTLLSILTRRQLGTAIIGIGPWFFREEADGRWAEYEDAYFRARDAFGLPRQRAKMMSSKTLNLINFNYFERNIEAVLKKSRKTAPAPTNAKDAGRNGVALDDDEDSLRPDGSLMYSRQFLQETRDRSSFTCFDYKIERPYVEEKIVSEFEQVVQRSLERRLKLVFLLMPYPPQTWTCTGQTPAALAATGQKIREIAAKFGVSVLGNYDSRELGLGRADFYDYMHVDSLSLHKITR